MNILIVDFHAGCIASAATTFLRLGHQVTILSLSGHTHLLRDIGLSEYIAWGDQENAILKKLGLERNTTPRDAVRQRLCSPKAIASDKIEFDLAFVFFPPGLYQRVLDSKLAKKVIVVASHRFDMWFDKKRQRRKFHKRIKDDALNERIFLYASNEFDQSYIEYYLGIRVEILAPFFPYLEAPIALGTRNSHTPLIGPAHVRAEALDFLTSLNDEIFSSPKSIKELYGNYTFENLANHSKIVLFPYSIYSISLSEIASLGLLMLFPTDRWLADSQILDDVQLFPYYAKEKNLQDFNPYSMNQLTDPNVGSLQIDWINRASWKNFPNVEYWDSKEELIELLQKELDVSQVQECVKRSQVWDEKNLCLWIDTFYKFQSIDGI